VRLKPEPARFHRAGNRMPASAADGLGTKADVAIAALHEARALGDFPRYAAVRQALLPGRGCRPQSLQ